MRQIEQVYCNDMGMSFYWKQQDQTITEKIQLVFKETGFYFTVDELVKFSKLIEESCRRNVCSDCSMRQNCMKFLLKTPISQIDLAVSVNELDGIKDLVLGTLFRIRLVDFVSGIGRN